MRKKLKRITATNRQYHSQDFLALGPHSQVNAGIETLAVDQDVAGSALSYLTALLDAGKAEIIPQHIG